MALGEMRLEVIVDGRVLEVIVDGGSARGGGWPFLAEPASAMGEGMVSMGSGGLLSLFKVCGLSAPCKYESAIPQCIRIHQCPTNVTKGIIPVFPPWW